MNSILRRRRAMMEARESDILYEVHNQSVSQEYISTGIKLLETDFNWTIVYDISVTSYGSATTAKYIQMWNSATSSFSVNIYRGGSGGGYVTLFEFFGSQFRSTGNTSNLPLRLRFAITHEKNSNIITVKYRYKDTSVQDGTITQAFTASNGILYFGAGQTANKLPTGTLNLAVIYNRILSSDEINEFLGV